MEIDTEHFKVGDKFFCSYCGKELVERGRYDEEYIQCDCRCAKAEIEYKNNIERQMQNIFFLKKLSDNEIRKIKLREEIKELQKQLKAIK